MPTSSSHPVQAGWRALLLVVASAVVGAVGCQPAVQQPDQTESPKEITLKYPTTRKADQVDDYHGAQVADPYRWLEDLDSDETAAWVKAQNEVTFDYLGRIPEREAIRTRLTQLWDFERYGMPRKRGDRYFYTRNDGLQNQAVLYVADSLDGEPRVLLDPNKLSADGTVSLSSWRPSDDGRYLAYGLASDGSDWHEWKVLDVETGRELLDHLRWIKFSGVAWAPDGAGFYYSRYDEPAAGEAMTAANYYQKLYFHRLGTPQFEDELVYRRDDQKEWGFGSEVTEDGRYLLIHVWKGTLRKNQVFYLDLAANKEADKSPADQVVELISGFDAEYDFLGNDGSRFWLSTDLDAPRRRVIEIDLENPGREHWREVIPQADDVLQGVGLVGDRMFALYLKDAATRVKVFDLAGKFERDVELPGLCSAGGFGGRRSDKETFFSFSSYTTPGSIYRHDVETGESVLFKRPDVAFDPQQFETRQVFFTSKDGTKVPMFLSHRKGLELNGDNPTMLYGYGGFDISLTPGFGISPLVWMEMGGVYAVANLRGGGEYGRPWHEAGMTANKQNVFDDFIAAAEWLCEQKYTRPEKLAISGGSNGGLLVGAVLTQRPDLCAAAMPAVGVLDMLRYHKFTIGWAWVSEYGSSDDAEAFKTLFAYSPLHNLRPGTDYPATLVTTGDHDDRVVPAHSFKFAAALQAAHAGQRPALIRIETSAGHGAGKPTDKLIAEAADKLAFLAEILDVPVPQSTAPGAKATGSE